MTPITFGRQVHDSLVRLDAQGIAYTVSIVGGDERHVFCQAPVLWHHAGALALEMRDGEHVNGFAIVNLERVSAVRIHQG